MTDKNTQPRVSEQDERALFEKEANATRFFPREIEFSRTESPSGRDEYTNSHLQSRWEGWQARAALAQQAGAAAQSVHGREVILKGAHAEFSEAMPPGSMTDLGHRNVFNALRAAIKFYIQHPSPAATTASAPKMIRCEECNEGKTLRHMAGPDGPIEIIEDCGHCDGSGEIEADDEATTAITHGCHWKNCPHGAECVHTPRQALAGSRRRSGVFATPMAASQCWIANLPTT
jgi:phage FluMu protein Com